MSSPIIYIGKNCPHDLKQLHVPTKSIKGRSLASTLDVNGVMLGVVTAICQIPLLYVVIMATSKMCPTSNFWFAIFLCEGGRMLGLTTNMASKLLPTTNLKKQPQLIIHSKVDILPSW